MSFFSHKVHRHELKPGDHIYTWRSGFVYSHHGIYVGENMVVHFNPQENSGSGSGWMKSSSCGSSLCLNSIGSGFSRPDGRSCNCGFHQPGSGVTITCLNCFVDTGSLYLYQYAVNGFMCISKVRSGTCTTAQSSPPDDVIYRAMYLLDKGFGNYNLLTNNCEGFALYCKTGLLISGKWTRAAAGCSGQVTGKGRLIGSALLVPVVASAVSMATAVAPPVALTFGTAGVGQLVVFHIKFRYTKDLGVRRDTVEVPVEHVESFRNQT